jgi:hypothetical protein
MVLRRRGSGDAMAFSIYVAEVEDDPVAWSIGQDGPGTNEAQRVKEGNKTYKEGCLVYMVRYALFFFCFCLGFDFI